MIQSQFFQFSNYYQKNYLFDKNKINRFCFNFLILFFQRSLALKLIIIHKNLGQVQLLFLSFLNYMTLLNSQKNRITQIVKQKNMPSQQKEKLRLQFTNSSKNTKIFDNPHLQIHIPTIIQQLKTKGSVSTELMRTILKSSCKNLQNLSNLIEIESPVMVIGDIHGQFFDLLHIFQQFGSVEDNQYLFMGDYVDRGQFCIEVMTILLCLKLVYPKKIHLLRGNHQSRILTSTFNFRQQCLQKYDQQIYFQFIQLFDQLPLGAVIDGKYFCVHAGISPDLKSIQQIQKINRFKQPPQKGGVCDLLWSDPVQQILQKWMPNKNRMCSYFYGMNHSKYFLERNKLKLIIRGHQVQSLGYKYQKHSNGKPLTLTIFSAPNYCDTYRNKGAVLYVAADKLNIFSFSEVDHPIVLPNYMNIVEWSIPFLAQQTTKIFKQLLKLQTTKQKKIKSDKILKNEDVFKSQIAALTKIQLFQKVLQQKKTQVQQQVLKQSLKSQYKLSSRQFASMKNADNGEKFPSQKSQWNGVIDVIGPKLHGSFKKLNSSHFINPPQDDTMSMNLQSIQNDGFQRVPTLRIL